MFKFYFIKQLQNDRRDTPPGVSETKLGLDGPILFLFINE